ncbi:MAG: helix-turn-helix domain-containing protein, partial [Pseudomonadota bacterium]
TGQSTEPESLNLREVRQRAETRAIRLALTKTYGNMSRSAALLGITRPTLYDLMDKYGLSAEGFSRRSKAGG